jgi:histidine ammonia-lyase
MAFSLGAGEEIRAAQALRWPAVQGPAELGLEPPGLENRERVALLSSTDGMLGMLRLACVDAESPMKARLHGPA